MKSKKILISLIVVFVAIAFLSCSVFAASSDSSDVVTISTPSSSDDEEEDDEVTSDYSETETINLTTDEETESTYDDVETTDESDSSSMPYTGAGSNAIIFAILALIIVALFAYRKVSEYKDI